MDDSLSATPRDREIFIAASRIADPAERERFISRACGDDSTRCTIIAKLLAVQAAGGFSPLDNVLKQLAPDAADDATAPQPGSDMDHRMIDRYKLLEPIGEGGFGTVYLAEQTTPVRRKVALKVIKPGMDTKEVIARFEAERQALALMDHPNIARVVDAGTTPQGHPYFAMELVRGRPIAEHCDDARLTPHERLRLFSDVCHAVQHAHQKGLIHRDLKPSNVMVTMHDDLPVVKVIDFGVAKALNQQLTERTLFTRYGQMVGTPRYMSPEQAQLSGLDIDTRSDVYSLGVLLYELLTGTTPFEKEKLERSTFDEIRRLLNDVDPPRPSTRVSTLTAEKKSTLSVRQSTDPRKLAVTLSGELDWIVMKALEKNRNLRYQSASAFANDIERYLADEPVEACPPSWTYRAGKVIRRHKAAFTTAVLVFIALFLGAGLATVQAIRATRAETIAQTQSMASQRAARREAAARHDAEQLTKQTRRLLAQSYVARGVARLEENDPARSLPWLVAALEADAADEAASAIHRIRLGMVLQQCPRLVALFDSNSYGYPGRFNSDGLPLAIRLSGSQAQVYDILAERPIGPAFETYHQLTHGSLSRHGRYAIVGDGERVWIWESAAGRLILELAISDQDKYCFSESGDRFALFRDRGTVAGIWETSTGRFLHSIDYTWPPASNIAFSNDGNRLVWVSTLEKRRINVWDATDGCRLYQIPAHQTGTRLINFNHRGTRIITHGNEATVRIWDAKTFSEVTALRHADSVVAAYFSPDDSRIATISDDGTAQLWDPETGRPTSPPLKHGGALIGGAFSSDGRYFVAGSYDNTARVWDTATGELSYPVLMHHTQVPFASFDRQGRYLMTIASDGVVYVWDLASTSPPGVLLDHHGPGVAVQFRPDSRALLGTSKAARLWDVRTGEPPSDLLPFKNDVSAVAFSATGKRIAARVPGRIQVVDGTSLRPITATMEQHRRPGHRTARDISFGFDDRTVLALFGPLEASYLRIYDSATGERLPWPVNDVERVSSATFSYDGRFIATGSADGVLRLWSGVDGTPLSDAIVHRHPVLHALFSRDNRRVVTISAGFTTGRGELRSFDAGTLEPIGTPIDVGSEFTDGDVNRDGSHIVVASRDKVARVWDLKSGKPITPPMRHPDKIHAVRFSPDGRLIATTTGSTNANAHTWAVVYLWDAATGQLVSPPLRHSDPRQLIESVTFSPDGQWLASISRDGTTRILPIAPEEGSVEELARLAEFLSSHKFDSPGALVSVTREEKLAAWRSLRAVHPEPPATPPQQVIAWHHANAVFCMANNRWADAKAHLDAIIAQVPDEWIGVRLRRIHCAAALGQWQVVSQDLRTAQTAGWKAPLTYKLTRRVVDLKYSRYDKALCNVARDTLACSKIGTALRLSLPELAKLSPWHNSQAQLTRMDAPSSSIFVQLLWTQTQSLLAAIAAERNHDPTE